MMKLPSMIAAALLAFAPAAVFAEPADVAAAVANTDARTEANVKLDESRKPAELLAFLGLEEGMRVIDMFGVNQYWAEIMAPAVGPAGHITVWQPNQFLNDKRRGDFAGFAARQGNVMMLSSPMQTPLLGENAYDFMIMNLDYHDVYWQNDERGIVRMEPQQWLAALYRAMKPGAVVGVIDHAANPSEDIRMTVEKLHRIDPAVVLADFERAGFVLDGSSDIFRNPDDDGTLNVFDEKIRGKTDRFVLKFRKPA